MILSDLRSTNLNHHLQTKNINFQKSQNKYTANELILEDGSVCVCDQDCFSVGQESGAALGADLPGMSCVFYLFAL